MKINFVPSMSRNLHDIIQQQYDQHNTSHKHFYVTLNTK